MTKPIRNQLPIPKISDELYIISGKEFGDSPTLQLIVRKSNRKYNLEEIYVTFGLVRPELEGALKSNKISISFFLRNMAYIRSFFEGPRWEEELRTSKLDPHTQLFSIDVVDATRQRVSNKCINVLSSRYLASF